MAEEAVSFCPRCGSRDVEPDFSSPAAAAVGGSGQWRCDRCDFTGRVFPEAPEEELPTLTPLDELPDREQVDTSYGRGSAAWLKYAGTVFTPLMAVMILLFAEQPVPLTVVVVLPLLYITLYLHNQDHHWVPVSPLLRYLAGVAVLLLFLAPFLIKAL